MYEAGQMLTKEYVKRVCLDSIDRKNFLDFVKPYRNGSSVDFEKIKQTGNLEEYNLLAYLTIASSLGKQVVETVIREQAGYEKDPQTDSKIEAQINRLKSLQAKTMVGQESGGFIDILEIDTTGGGETRRSSLEIGDNRLDVSGKTIEEQVALYQNGIRQMISNEMQKAKEPISEQAVQITCRSVSQKEPIIKEVVEEELKEKAMEPMTQSYQKSLTQENR